MRGIIRVVMVAAALAAMVCCASAAEPVTGKLTGRLAQKDGSPLSGGLAFFFNQSTGVPPLPEKYWRVPDEIAELDAEGRFTAELIEGTYFVGAVKRAIGRDVGPPNEGDLFLVSRDPQGKPRTFAVKARTQQDIGTIAEALPFVKSPNKGGITGIEGVVEGEDGKPIAGVFVFAFMTPSMVGRPQFVAERTGADGRFLLRVAEAGNYYLKVRDVYGGGPPRQGGIIGGYVSDTPQSVAVKANAITKGVSLKGIRFQGQGQARKP